MMNPISLVIYMMILHSATATPLDTPLENSAADCSLFTLCVRYITPLTNATLAEEICLGLTNIQCVCPPKGNLKSVFESGLLPVATRSAMPRKYLYLPPAPLSRFDGKIILDATSTFALFEQILIAAILIVVGLLLWSCCPCLGFQVPWASHDDVMNALKCAEKKHKKTLDQPIQDMVTHENIMSSCLGELDDSVKNMVNKNATAYKDMDYKLECLETKCQKVVDETSDALTHIKSISLDLKNVVCGVTDLHNRVASFERMLEKFEVKHDKYQDGFAL